ncbi:hypothetical protein D3C78_1829440 [compost metagenome]
MTGTKGFAELRLVGDPGISTEPLVLTVTNEEEWRITPLEKPGTNITEDFLMRIDGKPSLLTHDSIWKASLATIEADARVTYAVTEMKEG